MPSRRTFLAQSALAAGTLLSARSLPAEDATSASLIESITPEVIFDGRKSRTTWFHPRACLVPTGEKRTVLMTMQTIGGSDYFGHVHWTQSDDLGHTWSEPQPIAGLGRHPVPDETGYTEGVCDVVPEHHAATDTALAIGHNVYYKAGHLARPQLSRWPVYVVRSADGSWSKPQKLEWKDTRGAFIYTCNCSQRVNLDGGDVLIPFTFGPKITSARSVTSVRCSFDGEKLLVRQTGNELKGKVRRGLLEPSLTRFGDQYLMTIRAEDNRGYVSASQDGLTWSDPQSWTWDDGQPLSMSTTQQHWLPHSDGLFLVYTRKDASNANVFRWRSPLWIAQVDPQTLRLRRDTEQVVLPLQGDGVADPQHVARMGNFHPVSVTPQESWVTVGETLPADGWAGNTLLGRIKWNKPNRLITAT